jgi:hypothetical protein
VSVIDVDPAPDASDENARAGSTIGLTASVDAGGPLGVVQYSLSSNPGNLFAIDTATGVVTVAAAIDREIVGASVVLEITATAEDGSTSVQNFTVAINDLNEFSVSAVTDGDAAENSADENAAIGTSVGLAAVALDADATTNAVHYELISNPGELFAIDPNTGVVTVAAAIDREKVGATIILEVTATSEDGSSSTQNFSVAINDVNEFPVSAVVDSNGSANVVDENAAIGALVGITTFATDADATTNSVHYALTSNPGGLDVSA